jgi:hypothetical protein
MRSIHRHIGWHLFVTVILLCSSAAAQTSASLLSADYSEPAPFLVAPGQVVTLFFRGVGPRADGSLRTAATTNGPWPTDLAGLSLRMTQSGLAAAVAVPIVSVRQNNECGSSGSTSPICFLTALRIQIPFELAASDAPHPGSTTTAPVAEIVIEEDGKASRSFLLQPIAVNGHVTTSCDLAWDINFASTCTRSAYHSDGSEVNTDAPARLGETVVVFAYGLGQSNPPAKTGQASPQGAVVLDPQRTPFIVTFVDSFLDAPSYLPRHFDATVFNLPRAPIQFGGLSPNQVGLYQINVPIPRSLKIPILCGPDPVHPIVSNTLLQVTTAQGTENVPICIAPKHAHL